jgi:hypothetical protein
MYYLQTIFAPNNNQLNRNIASIKSLDAYLKKYPYPVILICGGWCESEEYWDKIITCLNETTSFKSHYFKFNENKGKSFTINFLFDNFLKSSSEKYFLTADSDICFDLNVYNFFERLEEAPKHIERITNKSFGMIALNQTQMSCHVYENLKINHEYSNSFNEEEIIISSSNTSGIAGGCLYTSTAAWKKINGYRLIHIYGGDDGYYAYDNYVNNFSCDVLLTLSIIHPFDTDKDYQQWKSDQIKMIQNAGGHNRLVDEYLKSNIISTDFWKNKPK